MRGMRAKKSSRESTSRKRARGENAWMEVLESMEINDDHWWCIVTMVVESSAEHARIVSLLNEAAEEGRRRAIYTLSRQKAMSLVRILSREDPGECETLQTVCHYARSLLDADEPLSSWLLARLVKYFVYRAKVEAVIAARRERDLQMLEMLDASDVGKSATSDAAGKDSPQYAAKANTRLRRRGASRLLESVSRLDDAPLLGPNLYVILLGFHEAGLPVELAKAGVPLTCVLRIKRPAEKSEIQEDAETRSTSSQFPFRRDYAGAGAIDFHKFWTTVERDLKDEEKMRDYNDFAFLTFCPPRLPDVLEPGPEYEQIKADVYDRVSYIVYDLYDLTRQYVKYIRSTKLQKLKTEQDKEPDSRVYQEIIDSIPEECVGVAVVLFALLIQVEKNSSEFSSSSSGDDSAESKTSSLDIQQPESEVSFFEEKLAPLDKKYRVLEGSVSADPDPRGEEDGIKLILHGDKLGLDLHEIYLADAVGKTLGADDTRRFSDAILRIFADRRITELWERRGGSARRQQRAARRHMYHVNGIAGETLIDRENALHYIHVSLFDKMIDRRPLKANDGSSIRRSERKARTGHRGIFLSDETTEASSERSGSLGIPTSRLSDSSAFSSRSSSTTTPRRVGESDGLVNYARDDSPTFNHSSDSSSPEYPRSAIFHKERREDSLLEEYEYLELLAPRVFLQTLRECHREFDHLDVRYCEATDSMLLYFHLTPREERKFSSLRSLVSFREFCEHVVIDEDDWMRREAEEHRAEVAASTEYPAEKKVLWEGGESIAELRDECFILPQSLKARTLQRNRVFDKQRVSEDKNEETLANKRDRKDKESSKERKFASQRGEEEEEESRRRVKEKSNGGVESTADGIDTSFLPRRKILSPRCAEENEPSEFLAYELDGFCSRLVSRVKTFLSCDGTRVRLSIDEWLRAGKDSRIEISSPDGSRLHLPLRLRRDGSPADERSSFHFVSDRGIILAFSKAAAKKSDVRGTGGNSDWRELNFDFRASWPSGLLVEPVTGDSPENSFYLRQFHASEGPACVRHESSRKFLRNGTLLKYHRDGTVHVYRPNGTIVKCTTFDSTSGATPNTSTKQNGQLPTYSRKSRDSRRRTDSKESVPRIPHVNNFPPARGESRSKVLEYEVLDHDGRHYEVSRDRVVREYEREFLSVFSDYDADEKFIRRADGTEMIFRSNGELAVHFSDGTRITTGYVIEDKCVSCGWTVADLKRFFKRTSDGIEERYEEEEEVGLSSDKSSSEVSSSSRRGGGGSSESVLDDAEIGRILCVEPFVSVLLTCRFQHEKYASVEYDPCAVTALLSMPGELRVSLSAKGLCELSLREETRLSVRRESVTLRCCSTTSVYDLDGVIFRTNDACGNVFEVDDDGARSYRSFARNENALRAEEFLEGGSEASPSDAEFHDLRRADQAFRIFALRRNLSAYEYLRRAVAEKVQAAAFADDGTSVIRHTKSGENPAIVTFTPLESRFPPKFWEKSSSTSSRRNHAESNRLRSTYSIPYDWLFPFGRKGLGIRANAHDVPLNKRAEKLQPELLEVRVLRRFKEEDSEELLRNSQGFVNPHLKRPVFDENAESSFAKELESIAIGAKKSIDVATYARGLHRKFAGKGQGVSSKLVASSEVQSESPEQQQQQQQQRRELEYYRKCWKDRSIIPYFQNIAGSCHLWVKSCVDSAVETVDTSQTSSERQVFFDENIGNEESLTGIYTTFAELFSRE